MRSARLDGLLAQKKPLILREWLKSIIGNTTRSRHDSADPFLDPIGHTISRELEVILDGLIGRKEPGTLSASLGNIIRIRCVQGLSPSESLSFIFVLKGLVRSEVEKAGEGSPGGELNEFESRIDALALLAMDLYMSFRDKVWNIRIGELKAEKERFMRLLERANAVTPAEEPQ